MGGAEGSSGGRGGVGNEGKVGVEDEKMPVTEEVGARTLSLLLALACCDPCTEGVVGDAEEEEGGVVCNIRCVLVLELRMRRAVGSDVYIYKVVVVRSFSERVRARVRDGQLF